MFGIVTGGWLLGPPGARRQGELDAGSSDEAYLRAKITTARFFAEQLLPQAAGLVGAVTAGAGDLYAIDADVAAPASDPAAEPAPAVRVAAR